MAKSITREAFIESLTEYCQARNVNVKEIGDGLNDFHLQHEAAKGMDYVIVEIDLVKEDGNGNHYGVRWYKPSDKSHGRRKNVTTLQLSKLEAYVAEYVKDVEWYSKPEPIKGELVVPSSPSLQSEMDQRDALAGQILEADSVLKRQFVDFIKAVAPLLEQARETFGYNKKEEGYWGAWCKTKLGWTPIHAKRLMNAHKIVLKLEAEGCTVLPTGESQVRVLGGLEDTDAVADAWQSAVDANDGKCPTAKQVNEALIEADLKAAPKAKEEPEAEAITLANVMAFIHENQGNDQLLADVAKAAVSAIQSQGIGVSHIHLTGTLVD